MIVHGRATSCKNMGDEGRGTEALRDWFLTGDVLRSTTTPRPRPQ